MSLSFRGRREDPRLVTGSGQYSDDWTVPGQLYACFRRSDRAHARIRSISTEAARNQPGIVAVITGSDIAQIPFQGLKPTAPPGRNGQAILYPERPLLAREFVRFVGEEIAMVIAESRLDALNACDLIEVELEDLPAIIGFDRALAEGAPTIHPGIPGNVCYDFEYGDAEKTTTLIRQAEHTVSVTLESPRVAPTPMEPRAVMARYEAASNTFEIHCPNQGAFAMRDAIATMLNVPPANVRVRSADIGGAFGARTMPFPEYVLLLHAARMLGRPIKWLSTRAEDFATDNHGRAVRLKGTLAFDTTGRFIALRTDWLCDSGAYLTPAGAFTNSFNGMAIGANVYQVASLYGRHRQVVTNTSPTSAYRGAGRPEAVYIVERLVDAAAAALGLDPFEIRRRNLIRRDQMPYRTLTGSVFDSGDFAALVEKVERASRWSNFPQRRDLAAKRGFLRGIGCSVFLEPSGGGASPKDQVAIRFVGRQIVLNSVASSSGQGHETVFPELVARLLGIDPSEIILRAGDPDGPPLVGSAAFGSRTTLSHGSGYKIAAEQVIEKGKAFAAELLEASSGDLEFQEGRYRVAGTDRAVPFMDVVQKLATRSPHPLDTIAEVPVARAYPSGAHVAEVEIDPETGHVEVVDYTAVDDIGNVINHVLADGQVHGGVMQGAGQVFGEHCLYDEGSGQLITGSFMDYAMPRATLIRKIAVLNHVVPSPVNALGAKGAGEAGATGALATCMNAVVNALHAVGVQHFDMPATPSRLWAAIQDAHGRTEK